MTTNDHTSVTNSRVWPAKPWRSALSVLLLALLTACQPAASDAGGTGDGKKHHALSIEGYNYTDRYIDQFSVNGQGGSNMDVSDPVAGGGKSACCIGWTDGTPLPQTVTVQWAAPGCLKKVTNSDGESRDTVVHTFKEKEATLTGPIPKNPGNFEVHIYRDGHVEVAITEFPSESRLKLDASRDSKEYPRCESKK